MAMVSMGMEGPDNGVTRVQCARICQTVQLISVGGQRNWVA